MSRSHRHNPIRGWTCADSEKRDKRLANRRHRRRNRVLVALGEEPLLDREAYDIDCLGDKDGKQYFDPVTRPECMRK